MSAHELQSNSGELQRKFLKWTTINGAAQILEEWKEKKIH